MKRRSPAVLAAASGTSLTAYVDKVANAALLETPPAPSPVVKTVTRDAIGITEWELANGVKVVLKPTTFKQDEIVFRAISPGGTSLASDADYVPASTATQVVTAGGLGTFSSADLRKVLTGKIASAAPFIGELEEGLSGSASPKDLETLFQLIYLRFTAPRADPVIFGVQTNQIKTLMANQANTPGFAFTEALTTIMGQNHPRRRLPTAATVDEWNLDKSMAFYKDRFADASDFTFVFVGNIDPAVMKPLVERYLGGLPSLRRKETWKDVEARAPTGVITKKVEKGIEPKSQAAIIFTGPFQWDQTSRIAIRAMADVLQTRLLDAIREDLGGTYSISASPSYGRIPDSDLHDEHRVRLRSQAARRARRPRHAGDREAEDGRPDREAGDRRARGAAAGLRDQQQAERLSAQPADREIPVRRGSRRGSGRSPSSIRRWMPR